MVIAAAGTPAARRRSASRSVSRSPVIAASRRVPRRACGGRLEERGLPRPRRAHQVDGDDAVRVEVRAVVRRRPVVSGEQALVELHGHDLPISASADVTHRRAPPARLVRAPARRRRSRRAGHSQAGQNSARPSGIRAPQTSQRHATGSSASSRLGPAAQRAAAARVVGGGEEPALDARERTDAHRDPAHGGRVARAGLRLDLLQERLDQRVLVHGVLSRSAAVARPRAARCGGGCRCACAGAPGRARRQ